MGSRELYDFTPEFWLNTVLANSVGQDVKDLVRHPAATHTPRDAPSHCYTRPAAADASLGPPASCASP